GPKGDIDRVVEQYLSRYEIQLENALSELKTVVNLRPFLEINPYKAELQAAEALMETCRDKLPEKASMKLGIEEAVAVVRELDGQLRSLTEEKEALEKEADTIRTSMDNVIPFANLNYDLKDLMKFKYVKFRLAGCPGI